MHATSREPAQGAQTRSISRFSDRALMRQLTEMVEKLLAREPQYQRLLWTSAGV